jgi:hypothetical protein
MPHPEKNVAALETLAEMIPVGFSQSDWNAMLQALPPQTTLRQRLHAAQLVLLWKQQDLEPEWWQPVLKEAAKRDRVKDVLFVCQIAQREKLSNHRVMVVLESGLAENRPAGAMIVETRELEKLASNVTPLDQRPEVHVDVPRTIEVPAPESTK